MSYLKNEYVNDLYQASLITVAAVGVSMLVRKVTGQSLAAPASFKETGKLALAVAIGTFGVKKAQEMGYIPKELGKKD